MTTTNPWSVDTIEMFLYLNCPECVFLTKEKATFKNHALENHPLSNVFFGDKFEDKNLELNSNEDEFNTSVTNPMQVFLPIVDVDDSEAEDQIMIENEGEGLK